MDQNKFRDSYFNHLFEQVVDYLIIKANNKHIQEKVQEKLLDPMIDYIGKRLYPYILMISGCFVALILLLLFMISTK